MDTLAQARSRVAKARAELTSAQAELARLEGGVSTPLPPAPRELVIIRDLVAEFFRIPVSQLCGPTRPIYLAEARQIGMVLGRQLTDHSLHLIGSAFCRDPGAVLHALKALPAKCSTDRQLEQNYEQLKDLSTLALLRLQSYPAPTTTDPS